MLLGITRLHPGYLHAPFRRAGLGTSVHETGPAEWRVKIARMQAGNAKEH